MDYNPALPKEGSNLEAYKADFDDENWRIHLAFPMIFNIFMLSSYLFFFKEDSIMFNLQNGKE